MVGWTFVAVGGFVGGVLLIWWAVSMGSSDWRDAANKARQEGRDVPDPDDLEAKAKFMDQYYRNH